MDVHPILAPSEIIAPSSNASIPAINDVATIDENLVQTQVGLSTEDRIAVDEICAENIAYDNHESETTRYETQEEILADITRLSNDGYGRAVGNTGSGDEYSSEDSNNEAFTFRSMNTRSARGLNFIKYPHLVEGNKNPDCHVIGTLFEGGKNVARKGPRKN